jgi:uncharacterized protein with ParB-like and HNH nuclease domain
MEIQTLFSPDYKAINDVFGNDILYKIPSYQRPYSWECTGNNDKNNQINIMWQDLFEYFESKNPNPYFLGSMVLIGSSAGREFDVIDGQQRLTTFVLLFISIKCFLEKFKNPNSIQIEKEKLEDFIKLIDDFNSEIDRLVFNKKRHGGITIEKKVKIERVLGFDYDNVLNQVMSCQSKNNFKISIPHTEENKEVSYRYFDNKEYFEKRIEEVFLENDKITEASFNRLNDFLEFLKNKIVLVRIFASRFDVAYQVFEILNNRGLPLSNKDLFRNFLISEFYKLEQEKKTKQIHSDEKWQELEMNYNLDNDFISRYVESINGQKQKSSAFSDLNEIYNQLKPDIGKSKIETFYDNIKLDLDNYTKIKSLQFEDNLIKSCIQFLLEAGNLRYTINLLLTLFRNIGNQNDILKFLKVYEKYIFFMIIGPSKRFSTATIYKSVRLLNNKDYTNALKEFELEEEDNKSFAQSLDKSIKDNEIAKLLIVKYIWIEQLSKMDDLTTNIIINYESASLEHIIPQNPDNSTNWKKDFSEAFRKEYTYKLGNFTILTNSMNSAAKNFDFSKKQEIYKKTKLFLTE